jgi:hypothetical protein
MLRWTNLNMLAHYTHGFKTEKLEAQGGCYTRTLSCSNKTALVGLKLNLDTVPGLEKQSPPKRAEDVAASSCGFDHGRKERDGHLRRGLRFGAAG